MSQKVSRIERLKHLQTILSRTTTSQGRHISSIPELRGRDGFCVRVAGAGDTDGILALSRAALGRDYTTDYLPGWLPRVLTDPNRVAFVGEKDHNIVAFMMGLCGVDGGRTLLAEAGRVLPAAAGAGLMGRMVHALVATCACRHTEYTRLRSSSLLVDFWDKNMDRIKLLGKRVNVEVPISASHLPSLQDFRPTFPVTTHRLSREEFRKLLSDRVTMETLYPQGLVDVGFNVFDAVPGNLDLITYFHDVVYAGVDGRSVSIGGGCPCDEGRGWRDNMSYSGIVDLNTCVAHLLEHLKIVSEQNSSRNVYLFLSLAKSFKNLFGKQTIIQALQDSLHLAGENLTLRMQYQYEYI